MEASLTFLVIVLSLFLALFLLLSIVLLIKSIQVVNQIKRVSGRIEAVVDRVDRLAEVIENTSGSLAIGKLITKAIEYLQSKKESNPSKEE